MARVDSRAKHLPSSGKLFIHHRMELQNYIKAIPDFPKPGILFRDMSPLLRDPQALKFVAEGLAKYFDLSQVDAFAGIESRGFILASLLAGIHGKGFLPIRKAGKLPPPTFRESYQLEYGEATLELAPGAGNIVILDDVLATGGTLQAAITLAERAGYKVVDVAVLINLTFLNQMKFQGRPISSMIQY